MKPYWISLLGLILINASARAFVPSEHGARAGSDSLEYYREWSLATTVGDYQQVGRTNSLWDKDAIAALENFARFVTLAPGENTTRWRTNMAAHANRAAELGCDDPLLRYVRARYLLPATVTQAALSQEMIEISDALEKSAYSPFRKLFANLRAASSTMILNQRATNGVRKDTARFERASVLRLNEVLTDRTVPPKALEGALAEIKILARHSSPANRALLETLVFPTLDEHWKSNTFTYLFPAQYHVEEAWRARGNGLAYTVTDEGARAFEKNLTLAERRLRLGWQIDLKEEQIPIEMITVCMGLSYPRAEMERWFARAMQINPNSYDAVSAKALYLEPKWGGTEKDLLAFGRETVANRAWGGRVPMILRYIHRVLQGRSRLDETAYYTQPEVWQDLRNAYERYFEANPNDIDYRHNYAKDAYRSAQYQTFLEQVQKFTTGTDHDFFGGQEKFETMLKTARTNSREALTQKP